MKNKIICLFVLLCVALSAVNVEAYDKDTIFVRTDTGVNSPPIKYGNNSIGWSDYVSAIYYGTNSADSSEKYYIYCADPGLAAWTNMKVDHILMGSDSTTKAEDYGILKILQNGLWDYDGNPAGSQKQYSITSAAIRMYVNAILGWNFRHTSNNVFPSYVRTTYDWVSADSEMVEYYTKITGKEVKYIYKNFYASKPSVYFKYTDASEEAAAKALLKAGMAATVDYLDGNVNIPEYSVITSGGTNATDTGSRYERMVVVSISLKNFSDPASSYFYYKGAENASSGATVEEIGYSFEYSEDANDFSANGLLSNSQNLIDMFNSNNKETIYIAYNVSVPNDDSLCNATFDVKYEYRDQALLNGAMLFPSSDAGKDYTDGQRFLLYSDKPISDAHNISVKMCNTACDPGLGLPQICEDESTPDADGNVEYEFREGYKDDTGFNVKCILENTDSANNSYKLVDGTYAGIVASNPYCSIYCKEDYLFKAPYKRDVDNGRYFKISMSMKGQQDCYSTKMNETAFNEDIIKAQIAVAEAFNEWQMNKELMDAYNAGGTYGLVDTGDDAECYKRTCNWETLTQAEILAGETPSCISGSTTVDSTDIKKFSFNKTYYKVDSNGAWSYDDKPASPQTFGKMTDGNRGTCNSSCSVTDYEACTKVTAEEDFKDYIESNGIADVLKKAKEDLENAIEKLKQTIDLYNACMADDSYEGYSDKFSTGTTWEMIYNYDPIIKYSYDEPNSEGYSGTKWIEQAQGLSCGDETCDVMVPLEEEIKAEKCSDEDIELERCTEVTSVNPIFNEGISVPTTEYCVDGSLNVTTYECSGSYGINFSTYQGYNKKKYFNCTISLDNETFTCKEEEYYVTELDYIHRIATSSGKYDTPRVYYSLVPSGEIKVSSVKVENSYLIDGLPVGADTPAGSYFYILSIDNLGQYYSSQKLGRIFGDDSTSLTTVDRLEREQTINNDELKGNEYACLYTVGQSCTDENGVVHDSDECPAGQDWNTCKKTLCPGGDKQYCVKEAESFYVCSTMYYDEGTCVPQDSRDQAISASDENYNCCPNCTIKCVGNCIYDVDRYNPTTGNLNLDFRPITPSIINPNDRQLGYNWDKQNPANVLVAQKAGNTISEIEARAKLEPTTATEEQLKAVEDYTLKVKMTPDMVTWIRNYNESNKENGSYNNQTLNCHDYSLPNITDETSCLTKGYNWIGEEESGKCVMANAFCYSEFITELDDAYDSQVDAPKRAEAIADANANWQTYQSVFLTLPNRGDAVPAGKEYEIITNDYWTIYKYTTLDINGDLIPDIGPAWK
ncbi:MAG: hypothetical protein E7167_03370 [Firmicutes bacterium]|nr:hypothetical protein [Bacillota bacterium]